MVGAATFLQLIIVGWLVVQASSIIPAVYPTDLKIIIVLSFVLAGASLSFGRLGILPSFALIGFWWMINVVLFVGNDFGILHPAGDGAKATVTSLFGWLPPAILVLCKFLVKFCFDRSSFYSNHSYVLVKEGRQWIFITRQKFLQALSQEKVSVSNVYLQVPCNVFHLMIDWLKQTTNEEVNDVKHGSL